MSSIVAAVVTHVGRVRDHNEDHHFLDTDKGVFIVCDGMGGHAAGEVASALAVREVKSRWMSDDMERSIAVWTNKPSPASRAAVMTALQEAVASAHRAIVQEAKRDTQKQGMGTTIVAFRVINGDAFFAHAGDSRGYLVRDGIAMQVTEDHTLLARLRAAGIDVDTTGDGARFRSMLTNALGIGDEIRVATFVVPLADGDRFLLCSDGISEYVPENEIGAVLAQQPSPARAAQKLVDLALERGGSDNATAMVVRVLEAGESQSTAAMRTADNAAIAACPMFAGLSAPQRLRATKICLPREYGVQETLPAHALGDRVAWVLLSGEVEYQDDLRRTGTLLYPQMLLPDPPTLTRAELATVTADARALAIRADDFRELCRDEPELGELLTAALRRIVDPTASESGLAKENETLAATVPVPRSEPLDVDDDALAYSDDDAPEVTEVVELVADEPPAGFAQEAPVTPAPAASVDRIAGRTGTVQGLAPVAMVPRVPRLGSNAAKAPVVMPTEVPDDFSADVTEVTDVDALANETTQVRAPKPNGPTRSVSDNPEFEDFERAKTLVRDVHSEE